MNAKDYEAFYDEALAIQEAFNKGRAYERARQHKHDWRKLFLYVFGASFLAFATLYFLVVWLPQQSQQNTLPTPSIANYGGGATTTSL